MCLPADIWVLSADCISSGMSEKERELYNQAVIAGRQSEGDRDRDRHRERARDWDGKKKKKINNISI